MALIYSLVHVGMQVPSHMVVTPLMCMMTLVDMVDMAEHLVTPGMMICWQADGVVEYMAVEQQLYYEMYVVSAA